MQAEQKPIFMESLEAAELKTVTGWFSRLGRFWGDDEKMARFDGHTHIHCECGKDHEKGYCSDLNQIQQSAQFKNYPKKLWDENTFCVNVLSTDIFLYDFESIVEYVRNQGIQDLDDLKLVHCEGVSLTEIDSDHWTDDLPEDGELPSGVLEALNKLNEEIRNAGTVSYWPSKCAVSFTAQQVQSLFAFAEVS